MKMDDINRLINCRSKDRVGRNFNYLVADNKSDRTETAVTYELEKERFWGLSPKFSENSIQEWILEYESPLASKAGLDRAFCEFNGSIWRMSVDEEKSRALFKRTMLAFSQHFYFYYYVTGSEEEFAKIDSVLSEVWNFGENEVSFDEVDINDKLKSLNQYPVKTEEQEIVFRKINGRLPSSTIDKLNRLPFEVRYTLKTSQSGINYIEIGKLKNRGKRVSNLFKDKDLKNYLYCVSDMFYSGAMARVDRIEKTGLTGNVRINNYMLKLSIITYATHLGFKDPRMSSNDEFFSDREKEALRNTDDEEYCLQKKLIEECEEAGGKDTDIIEAMNKYLEKSITTHGINVSGNLITHDDQLIYTKRGKSTWDKDVLYCSVNGVCEVDDENVFYYNHSVDCDKPMIGSFGTVRGNFGGELSRETYAELGIDVRPGKWKYYGFCIMGFFKEKDENAVKHSFPLHINVLGYCSVSDTLTEVCKESKRAVEKKENAEIKGLDLITRKGLARKTVSLINKIFLYLLGIASDLLILIVVLKSLTDVIEVMRYPTIVEMLKQVVANLETTDKISLGIAAVLVVKMLIELCMVCYNYVRMRRLSTAKIIWHREKDDERFIEYLNEKYHNGHIVFLLMVLLYYRGLFNKDDKDND